MADMNSVNLVGNLVRDFEVTKLSSGLSVGKGTVAVNRNVKHGDSWEKEANFFDFTLFGKSADNLAQYLKKGKRIGITGSLRQEVWEKDGKKNSKVTIVADDICFASSSSSSGGNNSSEGFKEDIPF